MGDVDVDEVAAFLLQRRLYLSALELHTELLETGVECRRLNDHFANAGAPGTHDNVASSPSLSTTMQEIDDLYSRTGSECRGTLL